jgi:hypothetical protein
MIRDFFLHFIDHDLHGATQLIIVIPVIPADKKRYRSHSDDDKGKYADEYNGTVHLGADVHLEQPSKAFPVISFSYEK